MTVRVIARLDIKGSNVVKGIAMDGLRVVGNAGELARTYAVDCDELLIMDVVASLYRRSALLPVLDELSQGVFAPITVGGGLRSVEDMRAVLMAGADKVAINTAAIDDPTLISRAADRFGSQAIVVSIEAKRTSSLGWTAYTDSGRERTGWGVCTWAKRAAELGAGEILLTSVDRDGTRGGFDMDLLRSVVDAVDIPVVISGGASGALDCVKAGRIADGVALAGALHYGCTTIAECKRTMIDAGLRVRPLAGRAA